jgi:hypothetical protein
MKRYLAYLSDNTLEDVMLAQAWESFDVFEDALKACKASDRYWYMIVDTRKSPGIHYRGPTHKYVIERRADYWKQFQDGDTGAAKSTMDALQRDERAENWYPHNEPPK